METPLIIGSRGSDLALWQSRHVRTLLRSRCSTDARIEIIRTEGDRVIDRPFVEIEGKGFFTAELEQALRDRRIDLAVHSLKDLPTEMPPDLAIAAIPERADARDVLLVAPSHHDPSVSPLALARGARVGTSSVRRRAQLLALRPDVVVEPLRGNVPTRVRRLREGKYDAILIALAGVTRLELDLSDLVVLPLDVRELIPAPGQGALAVQVRADDDRVAHLVGRLHDPKVAEAVGAERSLLSMFGGGCSLPLGAHISEEHGRKTIVAFHSDDDGGNAIRVRASSIDAMELARHARERIANARGGGDLRGARVVVTREADDEDRLVAGLAMRGACVVPFPAVRIVTDADPKLERSVLSELSSYDWVLFPSANAVHHFHDRLVGGNHSLPQRIRVGVVGPGTARAARELGWEPAFIPSRATSDTLLDELLSRNGSGRLRFLVPSARDGRTVLAEGLRAAGHEVVTLPVYRTVGVEPGTLDPAVLAGSDYVLFASPSAVQHFLELADVPPGARVVTIGPVTTEAARERRLGVFAEAEPHTMEGLLACLTKD